MGSMAAIAEEHWRRWLPRAYASIPDRTAFFQELEDEAAAQIDELEAALRGSDLEGEGFLEKLGRYRLARLQAEELIYREVLLPAPEEGGAS